MDKEIRSEYIKNLVQEKDALKKKLNEMAGESLKDIVSEQVNQGLRKLISEADDDNSEDSYTEEEIDTPETSQDTEDEKTDDAASDSLDADLEGSEENVDVDDLESDDVKDDADVDADEDFMSDFDSYKDEEGEYDLRGMDKDGMVKVMKLLFNDNANKIRVYKADDGTIVIGDDDSGKQYVVDTNASDDEASVDNIDAESDVDFEIESDVTEEGCSHEEEKVNEDTGYTTNYQKETAMITPSNNEPADSKETYSMDGGVPTGTEKPFGHGEDNMNPYDDKVNESECETEFEIESDDQVEEATNVGGYAVQNSTAKSHVPNSDGRSARNQSKGGEYTSTQKPRYAANEGLERIMKKANAIFEENKQLRDIVSELRNQIKEAIVVNFNMGKVIKLMTENSTSKEEKMKIINKFNNIRTLQEAKDAYVDMDKELKDPNRIAKINNKMEQQLSEAKNVNSNPVVETKMYNSSDEVNEALSFMARLDAVK